MSLNGVRSAPAYIFVFSTKLSSKDRQCRSKSSQLVSSFSSPLLKRKSVPYKQYLTGFWKNSKRLRSAPRSAPWEYGALRSPRNVTVHSNSKNYLTIFFLEYMRPIGMILGVTFFVKLPQIFFQDENKNFFHQKGNISCLIYSMIEL